VDMLGAFMSVGGEKRGHVKYPAVPVIHHTPVAQMFGAISPQHVEAPNTVTEHAEYAMAVRKEHQPKYTGKCWRW
jgi:hypothetical protein